ncbi:MAG: hypothetical protein HY507_02225 [Candidatus Zambryskibacteria bacterium]|nr:hypothetical protein [Candidatus Zambryskibacteria bacterium]
MAIPYGQRGYNDGYNQTGLTWDYINAYTGLMSIALSFLGANAPRSDERMSKDILSCYKTGQPLNYDEQYRRRSEKEFEEVMRLSDPAKVAEANRLAEKVRADLPRIAKEKDFQALVEFCRRADRLIRNQEFPNKS